MVFLQNLLPPHSDDPRQLLLFLAFGAIGGLVGGLIKNGRVELPSLHVEHVGGEVKRYVDPGFLSTMVCGALVAAYVDGRPFTAVLAGIAVNYAGRELLQPLIAKLVQQQLGLNISFQAPPVPPVPPEQAVTKAP